MPATDASSVERTNPETVTDQADRVVLSFRSPETDPDADTWWIADSEWIQERMAEPAYVRYLRWAHAGPIAVGEEYEEFVNCGCESPQDVVLRVERVEGGSALGSETTLDVISRKAMVDEDRRAD